MIARALIMLVIIIELSACVPVVEQYYRPSATGGHAINDACGVLIGPADTLKFKYFNVDVRIFAGNEGLSLNIRIPSGTTIVLGSPYIVLKYLGVSHSLLLSDFEYADYSQPEPVSVPTESTLEGYSRDLLIGGSEPRLFSSQVRFPVVIKGSFSVLLPTLDINGKIIQPPPVMFETKTGFGIYPVNC